MTRVRSLAAGGAALALAFVMAGCGGDDTLTVEEFKTQADAICADFEKKSDALASDIGLSPTEETVKELFKKAADLLDQQSDEIAKLKAPESIADDVDAMLDSVREGAEKVRESGMELIESGENPLEEATKKAKDLGLETCGSDS